LEVFVKACEQLLKFLPARLQRLSHGKLDQPITAGIDVEAELRAFPMTKIRRPANPKTSDCGRIFPTDNSFIFRFTVMNNSCFGAPI
jgi:hypothetical protein